MSNHWKALQAEKGAKVLGPSALSRALGDISPQAISQWERVPAERVVDVERVSGVPRHELRPDLHAKPEQAA